MSAAPSSGVVSAPTQLLALRSPHLGTRDLACDAHGRDTATAVGSTQFESATEIFLNQRAHNAKTQTGTRLWGIGKPWSIVGDGEHQVSAIVTGLHQHSTTTCTHTVFDGIHQ